MTELNNIIIYNNALELWKVGSLLTTFIDTTSMNN